MIRTSRGTRKQLAIPVYYSWYSAPVRPMGCTVSLSCPRQQWDTMRNPVLGARGRFLRESTRKISGGQCHTRLANKNNMQPPKICGLLRNFFPRLSDNVDPDLEPSRRDGAPARGMWAREGRGYDIVGLLHYTRRAILRGSRIYLHYQAFNWRAQYFSYLCRDQQCYSGR